MKACATSTVVALTLLQGVATASAGDRATLPGPPATATSAKSSVPQAVKEHRSPDTTPLDRVADAVDGAESSHGADLAMWRPDPSGPQGPMQVSSAAATDVGGGDRFDAMQNRALGAPIWSSCTGGTRTGRMRSRRIIGASATWTLGSRQDDPPTNF